MPQQNLFYLRYSNFVPKTSVGTLQGPILAYIAVPQLNPNDPSGNITIVDESFRFPENTALYSNKLIQFTGNFDAAIPTNNILVTTYYSNTVNNNPNSLVLQTQPANPLWYQFKFDPQFPIIQQPNGSYSVTITDSNGATIDKNHYILVINAGQPIIYTDLINTENLWYYINYLTTNSVPKQVFLAVSSIFTQASSSNPGTNQYTIQQDPLTGLWRLTVNTSNGNYPSVLPIGNSNIQVQHPIQAQPTDAWYCQITNGYFQRNLPQPDGSLRSYRYFVPEYQNQPWNPQIPYMLNLGETPIFIDNQTLRLRNIPLMPNGIQPNQLYIYIRQSSERSDNTNQLITAAGNNEDISIYNPSNNNIASAIWYRLKVNSIDTNSGLIAIGGILNPDGTPAFISGNDALLYNTDQYVAFYYYQQLGYIFNQINLNPIYSPQLLNQGVSIYIQPAQYVVGNISGSNNKVVAYLFFDVNNKIIGGSSTSLPIGMDLDVFYSTGSGSGIPGIFDDRTTFLELARIFVRNTNIINDITNDNLVDARIQGGRLENNPPPEIQSLINSNTNGMWSLFNWGGIILPGNSVIVINLPSYLTNDDFSPTGNALSGNNLTNRLLDIRRICKKNMAFGVLPIIRFYDSAGNPVDTLNPPLDLYYTYN